MLTRSRVRLGTATVVDIVHGVGSLLFCQVVICLSIAVFFFCFLSLLSFSLSLSLSLSYLLKLLPKFAAPHRLISSTHSHSLFAACLLYAVLCSLTRLPYF